LDDNLFNYSGNRRRDFGVNFVCGDFYKGFINIDAVANLLEPAGDCSFGN
jgi:hypothetical protein